MRTNNAATNTTSSTNTEWEKCPQFYINGLDREQLGIATLVPDLEAYWDTIENGLGRSQSKLTVMSTSKGKVLLFKGNTCIAVVNGKAVDTKKLAKYLHADSCVFTKIGGQANPVEDLADF